MVTTVTSFSRNGMSDWLVQRASAVVLAAYVFVLVWFFACGKDVTYVDWYQFMMSRPMRIFNVLAMLSLVAHAWVGLWTIATDYLKCTCVRLAVQGVFAIVLAVYLLWAVTIFWA